MLGVVVVVGAVEVGGHHGDVVRAVLTVEELTVLEAGDLGKGVGFVGLLQLAGEQAAFLHRLRGHAGINATAAQKEEFFALVFPGSVDDIHLEDHVVVHEVREGALVGYDPSDLGGRQKYVFRLLGSEEGLYGVLPREVQLLVRPGDDVGVALSPELPYDGASHHTPVAGDEYFAVGFHAVLRSPIRSGMTKKSGVTKIYLTIPFSRYSARLVRTLAAAPSPATFAMSASTIRRTNSSKLVRPGFQPSLAFALVGSPRRFTTSVGR